MNHSPVIVTLHKFFASEDWPWALLALQQEAPVWAALQTSAAGSDPRPAAGAPADDQGSPTESASQTGLAAAAMQAFSADPRRWTPAALGMLALGENALAVGASQGQKEINLQTELLERAQTAWKSRSASQAGAPITLETCMLLALSLYERRQQNEPWAKLFAELDLDAAEAPTVLACLAGLLSGADVLASALLGLEPESAAPRPDLAWRVILSQPRPEADQFSIISPLLEALPLADRLPALADLAARRPLLASRLAEACLAQNCTPSVNQPDEEPPLDPAVIFDRLSETLRQAEAFRLAFRPDRSVTLLAEALRSLRRQRGHLSAALARALEQAHTAGDAGWNDAAQETSLEAWRQAVQLAPETPHYAAGLIDALTVAGRLEEAQSTLAHHAGDVDASAALALAAARLADARNDPAEAARRFAQILRLIQAMPPEQAHLVLNENQFCELVESLRSAGKNAEAAAAAKVGVLAYPTSVNLLALYAPAALEQGRPQEALSAAHTALALLSAQSAPPSAAMRAALEAVSISALEASEAWQEALDLRLTRLEGVLDPTLEDLQGLRACAKNAGQTDTLEAACQGILEIDCEDLDALSGLAYVAQSRQDYGSAAGLLAQAVRLAPEKPELWLSLVEMYRRAGQETQAFDALRAACQAVPEHVEAHTLLGDAYAAQNQLTQALACYRRAGGLSHSADVLLRLGRTLLQVGRLDEAAAALEPALEAAPEETRSPELVYLYAQALIGLKRREQAIPLLVEVTRKDPTRVDSMMDLARAFMQLSAQPAGARRAVPLLERILGLNPDGSANGYTGRLEQAHGTQAEARALLAEGYAAVGDAPRAMQAFRAALDDAQNHTPEMQTRLSIGLGLAALKLDQPEMAIAALKDAAQVGVISPALQRSLSEAYLATGLAQDAFQAAAVVLEMQPDDPENLNWFIDQADRLSEQPEAAHMPLRPQMARALEAAVRLEPERPDLLARLGTLRAESGDRNGALDAYRRLVSAGNLEKLSSGDALEVARSARDLGDPGMAVRLLEGAIERQAQALQPPAGDAGDNASSPAVTPEPEDQALLADLYGELSLARQQSADLDRALTAAEKALDLEPKNPARHVRKADLLYSLNRMDPAMNDLRQAVEMAPDDVPLRKKLASWMRQRGKLTEALETAERGLEALDRQPASEANSGMRRSLSLLAAAVSQATLRPRRALAYLNAVVPDNDPAGQEYAYAALRAEIALDLSDLDMAQSAVEVMVRKSPTSPRTEAAMGRLAGYRGDERERERRCRSASRALQQLQMDQTPITPASTREEYIAAFLSTAQAAIDSRLWDEAVLVLNRLIEIIPETPLAYFMLAQVAILRGEAQSLLQDLDVTRHMEGSTVLSDAARQGVETNLARAQALLNVRFNLDASSDFKKWNDECVLTLGAWIARARALFYPDGKAARVYESLLRAAAAGAEDVGALMMAYRRSGEASLALNAAQVAWKPAFDGRDPGKHPLILLQMALSGPDPVQSLAYASKALEAALAVAAPWPPLPALEYLIARLAFAQRSFPAAIQAIQQALLAWPDEPCWQKLAGRLYQASSQADGLPDPVKALLHFEQALAHDPNDVENYIQIGNIYLAGGQTARAVPALENAVRIEPNRIDAWLALAQAQMAAGDLESAALSADKAIETGRATLGTPAVSPAQLAAVREQGLLLRGQIALQTGNPRGALSRAQALLHAHPEHPDALYLLAHALEALNRPGEALQALEKALPMSSNPLPMQIERVQLVRRSQGLNAAIAALQEMVYLPVLPVQDVGDDPAQQALAGAPASPAPDAAPAQPELLALLAGWLNETGQADAAIQIARTALADATGSLSVERRAEMNLLIGLQMRRAGQLDQAIQRLSEAINCAPTNLDAYLELGRAYQERREYRQALKVYQKAISVASDDFRPYYHAGLVLKDSKDYIAAEAMLRRASQIAPDEVSVHRLLGAVVALNLVHNRKIIPAES